MASYRRPGCEPTADGVRILIAEDEPLIALSISDLLEAEGYTVSVTSNGVEALAEVRRLGTELSVLVTDLNMPRMSGEDLISALQNVRPELPVIVVSGSAPLGGLEELRRFGGGQEPFALLHKPMNYDDLVQTLRRAVSLEVPLAAQGRISRSYEP
ncbi:response regulator [Belnapia moabensis]|uniref:response regulator n=1 Tax=Belnapia moabensis TaxID=365533 RepID=UPI0005BA9BFD|nr:response regulator [Belnapia moabensis]